MRKKINIHISDKDFPILFEIKNENLSEKYHEIFKTGYKLLFPSYDDTRTDKNMNMHTDLIKYELNKLQNKLENKDIDERITIFTDTVQDLLGINSSSTKKGQLSENFIYELIQNKFKDYAIEITRTKPHCGDGIITIPTKQNIKILLEIKNYANNVDTDELDKLLYDMKCTGIYNSIFISLKSSFVGKKRLEVTDYTLDNVKYTVVFVPHALKDSNRIETALILLERIIDMNIQNKETTKTTNYVQLYNNINTHLKEIDSIYSNFAEIKSNFIKTESNIKQNLSEHYKGLREYEIQTKNIINKLWNHIQQDFDKYKKRLIITKETEQIMEQIINSEQPQKLRNLKYVLETLNKYGLYILPNNMYDVIDNQYWTIIDSKKDTIGTLTQNKGILEVNLSKPIKVVITIKKDKKDLTNSLDVLEKILNY